MERMLKASEVSEKLGIPLSTVYHLADREELPHIHFGVRGVRFPELALEAHLRNQLSAPQNR